MQQGSAPTPAHGGPHAPDRALLPPAPIHGLAEQLARLAHFSSLDLPDVAELDAVALHLIGVPGDPAREADLWQQLKEGDATTLWHLLIDDWLEEDLDDIPERDWTRYSFATRQQEEQHRYAVTFHRLCAQIESDVAWARLAAREDARKAASR